MADEHSPSFQMYVLFVFKFFCYWAPSGQDDQSGQTSSHLTRHMNRLYEWDKQFMPVAQKCIEYFSNICVDTIFYKYVKEKFQTEPIPPLSIVMNIWWIIKRYKKVYLVNKWLISKLLRNIWWIFGELMFIFKGIFS